MLRDIRWRHMVAEHCHLFERRRVESRPIPGEPDKTIDVEAAPEHPVNTWLRSLSDSVIMGLIRENPHWLRNAAVADRICARRFALLKGNADARKLLRQLTISSVVGAARGRPSGPRAAAPARQGAMSRYEKEARGTRAAWLGLRADNPGVGLIELGRRTLRRLDGWDSPEVEEWSARRRFDPYRKLTEPQLLMHLGQLLLVVKDRDDKDYVVIDEEAWPRAEALALLSARWQVSRRWIREGLGQPGQ